MSILVKGMDMPKSCKDCRMMTFQSHIPHCTANDGMILTTPLEYHSILEYPGRHPNCPLMDMPEALDKIADFMGIDIGKSKKPNEERTCGNCKWSVGKDKPATYVVCKNKDRYIMPKAVDMFNKGCERWEKE